MICRNCGNSKAWHVKSGFHDGQRFDSCDKCGLEGGGPNIPDVYWPGQEHYNPNICDELGRPILLKSRQHKADVMKERQIREAGDSVSGKRSFL